MIIAVKGQPRRFTVGLDVFRRVTKRIATPGPHQLVYSTRHEIRMFPLGDTSVSRPVAVYLSYAAPDGHALIDREVRTA